MSPLLFMQPSNSTACLPRIAARWLASWPGRILLLCLTSSMLPKRSSYSLWFPSLYNILHNTRQRGSRWWRSTARELPCHDHQRSGAASERMVGWRSCAACKGTGDVISICRNHSRARTSRSTDLRELPPPPHLAATKSAARESADPDTAAPK